MTGVEVNAFVKARDVLAFGAVTLIAAESNDVRVCVRGKERDGEVQEVEGDTHVEARSMKLGLRVEYLNSAGGCRVKRLSVLYSFVCRPIQ